MKDTESLDKVITSERINGVYDGKIFRVDLVPKKCPAPENPDKMRTYEVVMKQDAVAVVVWLRDTDEILLVRQQRVAMVGIVKNSVVEEVIAGKIDTDLSPIEIAIMELEQEAGIEAESCELHCFNYGTPLATSPGFTNERIHLYWMAVDSSRTKLGDYGLQEEGEKTTTIRKPRGMMINDKFDDLKTYAAVMALSLKIERGEIA